MAITTALCSVFKRDVMLGIHNLADTGGDQFKAALYQSSATLGAATTAYTTTGEITGDAYTAGGVNLTNLGVTLSGTIAFPDFDGAQWGPGASFTAAGMLIYNSTAAGNPAVAVISFEGDQQVTNGTFTYQFPVGDSANAVIRLI